MSRARRIAPVRVLACLALAALPGCASGQTARPATAASFARADTAALRRTLDSLADAHHGIVGYTVHNLDTGERLERRGNETFPTASLIKVAILVTVYDLVEQGKLSLDDPL
nr:serine hydrolase [Gemmatimonadaceae bacterium]